MRALSLFLLSFGAFAVVLSHAGCTDSSPAIADQDATTFGDAGASETNPPVDIESFPLWKDSTRSTIGTTAEWTSKVELADVNGDGLVDILFANGGEYDQPGAPEPTRVLLNQGAGNKFLDATAATLGEEGNSARVVKVRDVNGDGMADIIIGNTYQTQSRLFFGIGAGKFDEVTSTNLPAMLLSVGDLEVGDVDGDGDLDIVVVDWGAGDPSTNDGGLVHLWQNTGNGVFLDSAQKMPTSRVRWSWDMELADVDNDGDLDVLVASKSGPGSFLFDNGGDGTFTDVSLGRLPQFTNNYEFEAMDVNGDGALDLITCNDGASRSANDPSDRAEHIFMNDGKGKFTDATATQWKAADNIGKDDNVVAFVDYDSDGDADFVIGSLSDPDRLLVNDGTGTFTLAETILSGTATPGTLGLAFADLDRDGRMDLVMGQGEVAFDDRVYLGSGIKRDIAPPSISLVRQTPVGTQNVITARVHDRKTPVAAFDFKRVVVRIKSGSVIQDVPMMWWGEAMFRARVTLAIGDTAVVCATDAAGNEACSK